MASVLRISYFLPFSSVNTASLETRRDLRVLCMKEKSAARPLRIKASCFMDKRLRISSFSPSAASGEASKVEAVEEIDLQEASENGPSIEDGLGYDSSSDESIPSTEDKLPSTIISSLEFYREALANNDQSKVTEIEAFFQSIEDERNYLENNVASLSEELIVEKDRILRISADFDNFRKRTERERLSLMENVQGELVESLLPVLDSFERAKAQIKSETEGEEKINSSYQSIYKQFTEILTSLGVVTVETIGSAFDPMLHEAIMREDSVEFEEGIILQEFRKGFKLGERLLRPSMVKVSAGPGPAKPIDDEAIKSDEGREELDEESAKESEVV